MDEVIAYCATHTDVLNTISAGKMVTLDESDIEMIQAILDDSSDDDCCDIVDYGGMPRPLK